MGEKENTTTEDVAFIHSATEDGEGARILRLRRGKVEAAEVRPAKEGQPLNNHELVRLHPRQDAPRICDVEVLYSNSEQEPESNNGPARVSSRAYRENWDRIFSSPEAVELKKPKRDWSLN
ncbi:MAG: hypothetical protein JXA30_17150 [Deltaproteobacteria bacterium]|nr:hypothetical protein [Deltaproteobacteria bacterium]